MSNAVYIFTSSIANIRQYMTQENLIPVPPLMTKKELADRLRVSLRTIDRGIKDGSIPHIKIGKTIRIHESVLQNYLKPEGTN